MRKILGVTRWRRWGGRNGGGSLRATPLKSGLDNCLHLKKAETGVGLGRLGGTETFRNCFRGKRLFSKKSGQELRREKRTAPPGPLSESHSQTGSDRTQPQALIPVTLNPCSLLVLNEIPMLGCFKTNYI